MEKFEVLLINCENTLDLTWSEYWVTWKEVRVTTFIMTYVKRYVWKVNLSTQDSAKLLQHLKSGFIKSKSKSKVKVLAQNWYLD